MRPHFLSRTPKKPKRSILGDLLVRIGFARRPVSTSNVVRLADVDPAYAKLLNKRRAYSHAQSKGARKVEAELAACVHEHLQRGRA